jgi:hypothetical protein
MDTTNQFCPNEDCRDYGRVGAGNIGVHSLKEKRCICHTCNRTGCKSQKMGNISSNRCSKAEGQDSITEVGPLMGSPLTACV